MKILHPLALATLFLLGACASPGEIGDACEVDEDCAEGLECHLHEDEPGEPHGDCEAHED